jgi:hypothetical protein
MLQSVTIQQEGIAFHAAKGEGEIFLRKTCLQPKVMEEKNTLCRKFSK